MYCNLFYLRHFVRSSFTVYWVKFDGNSLDYLNLTNVTLGPTNVSPKYMLACIVI